MYRVIGYFKSLNALVVSFFGVICTYFESTNEFMVALLMGFTFNILAGLRADKVTFKMGRVCNFSGHKLKDSLIELFLILSITYFLKTLSELMQPGDHGIFIVKWLIIMALYWYVRNGLRNLSMAYPKNRWIRFVYHLLAFQLSEFMPAIVKQAWDKSNKNENEEI